MNELNPLRGMRQVQFNFRGLKSDLSINDVAGKTVDLHRTPDASMWHERHLKEPARCWQEMKLVFKDIPYGVDHTVRVLSNAEYIMNGETVVGLTRETVSLAAILHDVGAVEAQRKHGSMEEHFQEIEGPAIARCILERIGAPVEITNRVCYIVGHHHTPAKIDCIDFRIVWEADYVEYLRFGKKEKDEGTLRKKVLEHFRTPTGLQLAYERLGVSYFSL